MGDFVDVPLVEVLNMLLQVLLVREDELATTTGVGKEGAPSNAIERHGVKGLKTAVRGCLLITQAHLRQFLPANFFHLIP